MDGLPRPRAHASVFGDQRAVEVGRERRDVAREIVGKPQRRYCVTNAATSLISCSLKRSLNAGIPPPPSAICVTAASNAIAESSRFGPMEPLEPAASNVWHPPQPADA